MRTKASATTALMTRFLMMTTEHHMVLSSGKVSAGSYPHHSPHSQSIH